jgi:hypothetical protein
MIEIVKGDIASLVGKLIDKSSADEQSRHIDSIIQKILDYETLSGSVSASVTEEVALLNKVRDILICIAVRQFYHCTDVVQFEE